jgi:hypothetical protein
LNFAVAAAVFALVFPAELPDKTALAKGSPSSAT